MDDRDMRSVSTKQLGIANTAKKYRHEAITVLHPNMDEHWLWEANQRVRKSGAAGVDGQSHADYEEGKARRLKDLLRKAKDGSYRAPPVKRVYIPKDGGEKRGIGIPTYEDKILQRAVVMLLEPIDEGMFHDFSFGFRPGKSPHEALKYLCDQCYEQDVAYVLDVDLRKYFDTINHKHLRGILHQRVGDGVITRLINKWLKAGVWEEGRVHTPEAGSPQGGVISPLLSNVYLHTVLGFTHYWGKSLNGNNVVHRKTSGKRFRRSLKAIKEWGGGAGLVCLIGPWLDSSNPGSRSWKRTWACGRLI
jgi:group II intron reverse transcriptase/maturase